MPWLVERLAECPSSHAQIVRSFAPWFLLHRARRNYAAAYTTPRYHSTSG